MRVLVALVLVVVAVVPGCSRQPEAPQSAPAVAPSPEAPAAARDAAAQGAPAAAAPSAAPQQTPLDAVPPVTGKVAETMDAGGYTYLRLQTEAGRQVWAAVPQAKVEKGATVTVVNAMAMEGFESPRLKRKFNHILFGTLAGEGAAQGGVAMPAGLPPGHPRPQFGGGATKPVTPVAVEKAAGSEGRTVAEVHAQRKDLRDKAVLVRGQVVKFLPGIMGRNWVHLRDGSGSAAGKDDDLTVTTTQTVEVGSVVVMRGIVRADKDFGAGYAYAVIVEEAKVAQ